MPTPNPNDLGGAHDLRILTPGTAYLNPAPRALFIASDGVLKWEGTGPLPDFPVTAGTLVLARPTRLLTGTTATVVALY
jgi:hypothetical protein